MSQIAEGIDAKGYLTGWVQGLTGMYCADINALPADKLTTSPGGVARSPQHISAEVVGLCKWTSAKLRGEEPEEKSEADFEKYAATLDTHESICSAIQAATAEFNEALQSAPTDRLNAVVTPPWKMDAPLYMIALIAANHIWYHDGQLNYLQALNGDDKMHWMPEN